MTAIVLAGGSVVACSGSDASAPFGPEPEQSDDADASVPVEMPASRIGAGTTPRIDAQRAALAPRVNAGYAVPACNANPDPCCRFPNAPGCRDAGGTPPE